MRFTERLEEPFRLQGVKTLKQGDYGVKLEFDTREAAVEHVVQQVMATKPCEDINIADPPLEEIIGRIYTESGLASPGAASPEAAAPEPAASDAESVVGEAAGR